MPLDQTNNMPIESENSNILLNGKKIFAYIIEPKENEHDKVFKTVDDFLKTEESALANLNKTATSDSQNIYVYLGYEDVIEGDCKEYDDKTEKFADRMEHLRLISEKYSNIIFAPGSFFVEEKLPFEIKGVQDSSKFNTSIIGINIAPIFYNGELIHIEHKGEKLVINNSQNQQKNIRTSIDSISQIKDNDKVECVSYAEDEYSESRSIKDPLFAGKTKLSCEKGLDEKIFSDTFTINGIVFQHQICADHRKKEIDPTTQVLLLSTHGQVAKIEQLANGKGVKNNNLPLNGIFIHSDMDTKNTENRTNAIPFKNTITINPLKNLRPLPNVPNRNPSGSLEKAKLTLKKKLPEDPKINKIKIPN